MTTSISRDFEGIWIERDIFLIESLSLKEKCLLAEIKALDGTKGCYAKNHHFAKILGCTERTIQNCLRNLKKAGLIYCDNSKDQPRILRITKAAKKNEGGEKYDMRGGEKYDIPLPRETRDRENTALRGIDKAMPYTATKGAVGKLQKFEKSAKRKMPLTDEQYETLAWLESTGVNTSKDSLTFWVTQYPKHKIESAFKFMHHELDRGKTIPNQGGFIRACLDGKIVFLDQDGERNKKYAMTLRNHYQIGSWKVKDKYLIDVSNNYELPFTIPIPMFKQSIINLLKNHGVC